MIKAAQCYSVRFFKTKSCALYSISNKSESVALVVCTIMSLLLLLLKYTSNNTLILSHDVCLKAVVILSLILPIKINIFTLDFDSILWIA